MERNFLKQPFTPH